MTTEYNQQQLVRLLTAKDKPRFERIIRTEFSKKMEEELEEKMNAESEEYKQKNKLSTEEKRKLRRAKQELRFKMGKSIIENIGSKANEIVDYLLEKKEFSSDKPQPIDDNGILFLPVENEMTLQPYFILSEEGKILPINEITKRIQRFLLENIKIYNVIETNKNQLTKKIIEEISKRVVGDSKAALTSKTGKVKQGEKIIAEGQDSFDKVQLFDEILSKFLTGDGKKLGSFSQFRRSPDTVGLQFRYAKKPSLNQTNKFLQILNSVEPKNRTDFFPRPFIDILEKHKTSLEDDSQDRDKEQEKTKIDFKADLFVGKLDLKQIKRREKIYNYWEDKYSDYENELLPALEKFVSEFEEVVKTDEFENKKRGEDKEKYGHAMKFIKEYKTPPNLNYIVDVEAQTIETYNPESSLVQAFESILSDSDLKKLQNKLPEVFDTDEFYETPDTPEDDSLDTDSGRDRTSGFEVDEDAKETGKFTEGREQETEFSDEGKVTGQTMSVSREEASKLLGNLNTELKELGLFGKNMYRVTHEKRVDPLFAYAFQKDSAKFKNLSLYEDEVERVIEELDLINDMSDALDLEINFDNKLLDFSKQLSNYAIYKNKENFYLPLSKQIHGTKMPTKIFGPINRIDIKTREKQINEFLENVSQFLDFGTPSARTSGESDISGTTTETTSGSFSLPSKRNLQNMMDDLGEAKNAFNELLTAIEDFYIEPMESINYPFDKSTSGDDYQFFTTQIANILTRDKKQGNVYFMMLELEMTAVSSIFRGNYQIIETITNLLQIAFTPSIYETESTLVRTLDKLRRELKKLFGSMSNKKLRNNMIEIELGNYYYDVMSETKSESELKKLKIFGKSAEDFNTQFEKMSSEVYPLASLFRFIEKRKTLLMKDAKKTGNAKTLEEFFEALTPVLETITKSKQEKSILEAHDNIRKMLNKPVYHKKGQLTNFEHVNKALEIMKTNFNVDLSVLELESIIKEFDSMQSIGTKYGLSAEGVYFLKANFR